MLRPLAAAAGDGDEVAAAEWDAVAVISPMTEVALALAVDRAPPMAVEAPEAMELTASPTCAPPTLAQILPEISRVSRSSKKVSQQMQDREMGDRKTGGRRRHETWTAHTRHIIVLAPNDARGGCLGQVVDLAALALVVGGSAVDFLGCVVQTLLGARGDLGDELLDGLGGGEGHEGGENDGLELHSGKWSRIRRWVSERWKFGRILFYVTRAAVVVECSEDECQRSDDRCQRRKRWNMAKTCFYPGLFNEHEHGYAQQREGCVAA